MSNELFKKLFAHMAWANQQFYAKLSEIPEEGLHFQAWNPEWTVGAIANHIVIAQGRFIARLERQAPPVETRQPFTSAGMQELGRLAAINDAKLATFLDQEDEALTFVRLGQEVTFAKSTVVTQIIHHATDHRAQVSAILATNGMDLISLDELDLWSYEQSQA